MTSRKLDWVLLLSGILAVAVAFLYMPLCADISQFSYLCLRQWLPAMVPLILIGGGAILFSIWRLIRVTRSREWSNAS